MSNAQALEYFKEYINSPQPNPTLQRNGRVIIALIEQLQTRLANADEEITRLKEIEWMYKDLCK